VKDLGLSGGDETGMWMLNYPFPYDKPEVVRGFSDLRDLLLLVLNEPDPAKFATLAAKYRSERHKFFTHISANDGKYFNFQLWQEGIARYTQVRAAEAAAKYRPSSEYAALPDAESFAHYAASARAETLNELKQADLGQSKRTVVYSFGAAEGFLLDRLHPNWKDAYFTHPLSLSAFFDN
jgi:hypothetical protein